MEQKTKPVAKTPEQMKKSCGYWGSGHPHRQCLACRKMCRNCGKTNHFKWFTGATMVEGMQSMKYNKKQQLKITDMVNINCVRSKSKLLVTTAKLKTSLS